MSYIVKYLNNQSCVMSDVKFAKLNMKYVKEYTHVDNKKENSKKDDTTKTHELTYTKLKVKLQNNEIDNTKLKEIVKALKKQYVYMQEQIVTRYGTNDEGIKRYNVNRDSLDVDWFLLENSDYYRLLGKLKNIENMLKLIGGYNDKLRHKDKKQTTIKTFTEIQSKENKQIIQANSDFTL